jgi:hypothetical protein
MRGPPAGADADADANNANDRQRHTTDDRRPAVSSDLRRLLLLLYALHSTADRGR